MQSAANQSPAPNSLLTGKITGNFAKSGPPPRFWCLISARIQELAIEFRSYILDNGTEMFQASKGQADVRERVADVIQSSIYFRSEMAARREALQLAQDVLDVLRLENFPD
jgi:hypothetical protein